MQRKTYALIASKPMRRRMSDSSVTRALLRKPVQADVTRSNVDQPAKRYERLRQWLELANISLPLLESGETRSNREGRWEAQRSKKDLSALLELIRSPHDRMSDRIRLGNEAIKAISAFLKDAPETADFPAGTLRQWSANRAFDSLLKLATRAAEAFKFCTLKHAAPDQATLDEGRDFNYREDRISQAAPEARVVLDRSQECLSVRSFDPYRDYFLPALEGVEIERIRRCPVCGKFLFALRWDRDGKYGSKACSKKCNQVRRMRDWRARQSVYEQNRKFKLAGVQPERGKS